MYQVIIRVFPGYGPKYCALAEKKASDHILNHFLNCLAPRSNGKERKMVDNPVTK